MKYYRNKDYGINLTNSRHFWDIAYTIESCKKSEKVVSGKLYVEVWGYTTVAYLPILKN